MKASPQQQQAFAMEAASRVARRLGDLEMQLIEAQTMADMLATDNARLSGEVAQLQDRVAELTPKE